MVRRWGIHDFVEALADSRARLAYNRAARAGRTGKDMARRKGITRVLKDADDVVNIMTGKRLHHLAARGFDLLVKPRLEKAKEEEPPPPSTLRPPGGEPGVQRLCA